MGIKRETMPARAPCGRGWCLQHRDQRGAGRLKLGPEAEENSSASGAKC